MLRFRNSLVNVRNGAKLKKETDDFLNNDLKKWEQHQFNLWCIGNPDLVDEEAEVDVTMKEIKMEKFNILHNFILQLLENNGFMFYESNMEEDDVSLN